MLRIRVDKTRWLLRRQIGYACLATAILSMPAAAGEGGPRFVTAGYQEVVFSVSDLADTVTTYQEVAGWQVLETGAVPRQLLDAYELAGEVRAQQVLLNNPGTERGYLRLMQFEGAEQQQIRSNAQTWETGGWFDVNARVVDMDAKFTQLQARGWQAGSDPVEFTFGPFVVKEWLARGHDGVVLALIERVAPPLTGWPHLTELSRFFNATQIVRDMQSALAFYRDVLGFKTYLEHHGASSKPGPNVLGLPHNLATEVDRHVYILHPQGSNEGSIELLSFDGLSGRDFSARAQPPNLGVLMLRFPVRDIKAFAGYLRTHKVAIAFDPIEIHLEPYGMVTLMGVRGPGGAWLEFFEPVQPQVLPGR